MFLVHFIDRVFLRCLVNSTLCLSMLERMEENTQIQARLHVNTFFRTLFVLFKRKVINFVQNVFLQMSER